VVEDENTAAAMCYTSGTTGNPKGVVYSHRSTVLHSMISLIADGAALSERDVVLPIVPMSTRTPGACPTAAAGRLDDRLPRPEHGTGRRSWSCWRSTRSR